MEAFCRVQEEEIIQLKTTRHEHEKLAEELADSRSKIGSLGGKVKSHRCSLEELKKAKSEMKKAQACATTSDGVLIQAGRDLEAERDSSSVKSRRLFDKYLIAIEMRKETNEQVRKKLVLKNATKDMLLVTGTNFEADAIGTAAEAIIAGRNPRSVVADMIRDGAV